MNGILAGEKVVGLGEDGRMLCALGLAGVIWSTGIGERSKGEQMGG